MPSVSRIQKVWAPRGGIWRNRANLQKPRGQIANVPGWRHTEGNNANSMNPVVGDLTLLAQQGFGSVELALFTSRQKSPCLDGRDS